MFQRHVSTDDCFWRWKRYWVKWDGEAKAKITALVNVTRLFKELLASPKCALSIKLDLARKLNNQAAKDFVAKHAGQGL